MKVIIYILEFLLAYVRLYKAKSLRDLIKIYGKPDISFTPHLTDEDFIKRHLTKGFFLLMK